MRERASHDSVQWTDLSAFFQHEKCCHARVIDELKSSAKLSCTPAFQPPEALLGMANSSSSSTRSFHPEFDPFAADVWALGVCLYCFLYGRMPFQVLGCCTAVHRLELASTFDQDFLPLLNPDFEDPFHPFSRVPARWT